MATHTTLAALFTDIANAIREKTGSTDPIVADDFPTAISDISSGGGVQLGSFKTRDDLGGFLDGTFQFEKGMTWGEFIESDYNTGGFFIYGDIYISSTKNMESDYVLAASGTWPDARPEWPIADGSVYQWVY